MRLTDGSATNSVQNKEGNPFPSFLIRAVSYSTSGLKILDQRKLPGRIRYLYPASASQTAEAIRTLSVRGAPNIGVAAAYGLAVEAQRLTNRQLRTGLRRAAGLLLAARPTAVNLSWAVQKLMRLVDDRSLTPRRLRARILEQASEIEQEELASSRAIARHGAALIPRYGTRAGRTLPVRKHGVRRPNHPTVLTICNTGALAAPGFGTALGVVFQSHLDRKRPSVYVCETRPLLQGARLTIMELIRAGIPSTLIVDSAAATVISKCNLVLVGADRIARNGDTANKVGTRMLAILAAEARRPFYVVAPRSSFDRDCRSGEDILVEERAGDEVRRIGDHRIAPDSTQVFNPAFDITPARYITGFITERGLAYPPFSIGRKKRQGGTRPPRMG